MDCRMREEVAKRSEFQYTENELNNCHYDDSAASKLHARHTIDVQCFQVGNGSNTNCNQSCCGSFYCQPRSGEKADNETAHHGGEHAHGSWKATGFGDAETKRQRKKKYQESGKCIGHEVLLQSFQPVLRNIRCFHC